MSYLKQKILNNKRDSAYYYGFTLTGVKEVDIILSAVAVAGKCFHNTDQWNIPIEYYDNLSAAEIIQEAANISVELLKNKKVLK